MATNLQIWARTQIRVQNEKHFQKRKYDRMREKAEERNKIRHDSINDVGDFEYHRNIAFLSTLILLYLFGIDDGMVSSKEQKVFKKVFKKHKQYLNQDDFEDLIKYTEKPLSTQDILEHITIKKYSHELINASASGIKKYISNDYIYIKTLNSLLEKVQ